MKNSPVSRRSFLQTSGLAAGAAWLGETNLLNAAAIAGQQTANGPADYTLHIKNSPVEIAPKRIVSATTYNGQFPGSAPSFQGRTTRHHRHRQ